MKNILIAFFLLALTACNSENKTNSKVELKFEDDPIDSNSLYAARVDSAKHTLDSVNFIMAKGITKTMSKKEVNNIVNPLMAKYFSLYKRLLPSDTLIVHQYRIDKINEMIDLQIKQGN